MNKRWKKTKTIMKVFSNSILTVIWTDIISLNDWNWFQWLSFQMVLIEKRWPIPCIVICFSVLVTKKEETKPASQFVYLFYQRWELFETKKVHTSHKRIYTASPLFQRTRNSLWNLRSSGSATQLVETFYCRMTTPYYFKLSTSWDILSRDDSIWS